MKIVKADAKGRVTGFEPGQTYTLGEQGGRMVAEKTDPPRSASYLRVNYATAATGVNTRITLEIPGGIPEIVKVVEELVQKHEPETVEVASRGMGFAVSDALVEKGIKHVATLH